MARKLTIVVDDDVQRGLMRVIGEGRISRFLNDLARPHVTHGDLDEEYRAMASDEAREADAREWADGLITDNADDPR